MAKKQFAQFTNIESVLGKPLTLRHISRAESVFGTSLYIGCIAEETGDELIITTGSKAIIAQFAPFDDGNEVAGMRIIIHPRGKSYQISSID